MEDDQEEKKPKRITRRMTPRAPSVSVPVTAEAIRRSIELGGQARSHICAIAEAIKLAMPSVRTVSVDIQTIRFSDPEKSLRYIYLTPRSAQKALIDFDEGKEPAEFTLNLKGKGAQVCRTARKPIALMDRSSTRRMENIPNSTELRLYKGGSSSRSDIRKVGGRPPPQMRTVRRFGLRAFAGSDGAGVPSSSLLPTDMPSNRGND